MTIVRNPDGTLVVPVVPERRHDLGEGEDAAPVGDAAPSTRVLHPGEGGYDDPEASGQALRHVLVGGVPSVEAFAAEVAEAEGGDPLPAHEATKIIGEVLAELD